MQQDENRMIESSGQDKTEILNQEPVVLQYFHAVDVIVDGVTPFEGKYFDISVFKKGEKLPAVKILRIQSNYSGGVVGKQDEIELEGKGNRYQFSAEFGSDGTCTRYPLQISEEASQYLADTVQNMSQMSAVDGSHIIINNSLSMIAKDGIWWQVEKGSTLSNPQLMPAKKQLPQ